MQNELNAHNCCVGKYGEIGAQLRRHTGSSWSPSFNELADLVPGGLPPSAYEHSAWWSNSSSHVQAQAWLAAGWQSQDVDLRARRVTFVRS